MSARDGIDVLLLDAATFTPDYVRAAGWFPLAPSAAAIAKRLAAGETPPLAAAAKACAVHSEPDLVLVSAACVAARAGGRGLRPTDPSAARPGPGRR